MNPFTESIVEEAALAWLEGLGYGIHHGPDIAPGEPFAERDDYGQVVLERRLNPQAPPDALDDVQVLVKPASVNSDGEPSWITGYRCKASVAFLNTNPDVDVRVLVRRVDEDNPVEGEWFNYFAQQLPP